MDAETPPTWTDVLAARVRTEPHVHRTPVLTSNFLNGIAGAELFFKCENLQKAGSFKARGACNAVFSLDAETAKRGVATHSSGNHGQALAYAAACRGIAATIVMPRNAPEAKRQAVEAYGGKVLTCEPGNAAREAMLARLLVEENAEAVHPYADARVIAGQASAALELLEEVAGLDVIVAPIGGGGLVSGTGLAARGFSPRTRIFAAEPELADDAFRSLAAGRLVQGEDSPPTLADGLRASLKEMTWRLVSNHVDRVLLAGEEEIVHAMRLIWQRMKIVIEPSSAVAVAAILRRRDLFKGLRTGVILSGGNVDLSRLPWPQAN